jgi:hypothetical protein
MRITTTARYRGLPVTLFGIAGAELLAVAAYGTPQELALARIAVGSRDGRPVYRISGSTEWTSDPDAAAWAVARSREARDAAELAHSVRRS